MYQIKHEGGCTLEDYLNIEQQSEIKHEYFRGDIYAMAGASPEHNQIVNNLILAIGKHPGCASYSSDQKVWIPSQELATYPDLTYACEKPVYEADSKGPLMLVNPTLIIEVLSPSTQRWDRNGKWECYQDIASLKGFMLVAQDRVRVEHYERAGKAWLYTVGTEDKILIPSLDCLLLLGEVYRGIELEQ